jgi:hypothetical protein
MFVQYSRAKRAQRPSYVSLAGNRGASIISLEGFSDVPGTLA